MLHENNLSLPDPGLIYEDVTNAWYQNEPGAKAPGNQPEPNPAKKGAYTWIKSVKYAGWHFEVGPLARMIINGFYRGSTSTMDRICARSLETQLICQLTKDWLGRLEPGPPPLKQKTQIVREQATAVTDAMRGALLHSAKLTGDQIIEYNIITPTVRNFSPRDEYGLRGPVESALLGTEIRNQEHLFTILGRIIRSFDPCLACATHVLDAQLNERKSAAI